MLFYLFFHVFYNYWLIYVIIVYIFCLYTVYNITYAIRKLKRTYVHNYDTTFIYYKI